MLFSRLKYDNVIEIGIDEAGRGSFWGPIMAGAVVIPYENLWTERQRTLFSELRDSKKISPKKRERIADEIKELIPLNSVGYVSAHEINTNGIQWANMEAFRRAISGLNLEDNTICRLIIDGILPIDDWTGEQEIIIEGDSKYLAIAAASIIAKVTHDRWIQTYCENYPECNEHYDLKKCKGYGTAKHREGIRIYGGHELHRQLYIQNWLPGANQIAKPRKKCRIGTDSDTNKCLIKFR